MKKRFIVLAILCLTFLSGCNTLPPDDNEDEQPVDSYTITWKNHDGTILDVEDGITKDTYPSYQGTLPSKTGDEVCEYRFVGWSPELSPVNGDITYIAEFTEIYTITWVDADGNILEVDEDVAYGEVPTYNGLTPTKQALDQCFFTFREWSPLVTEVTQKQTYTALFDSHGYGENLTYTKHYYDGNLMITGLNNPTITDLIIPNYIDGIKVVAIDGNAFNSVVNLTSLVIHDSLVEIYNYAFANCTNLTSIFLPSSLLILGEGAFYRCSSLEEVILPEGMVDIRDYAFACCSNLTEIRIPDSIELFDSYAFYECESLSFNEYDQVMYVGNENNPYLVLVQASSKDISQCVIHEDTQVIASRAFSGCNNLQNVIIPDQVISIGWGAFYDCRSMTEMNIPNSVRFIDYNAFSECISLQSVSLGEQITSIGWRIFENCTSLSSLTISENILSIDSSAFLGSRNINYNEYDNAIYLGNDSNPYIALIKVINKNITDFIIHEDTKIFASYAFSGCEFTSVLLPNQITSIGYAAFKNSSLRSIVIPDSVITIEGSAFSGCDILENVTMGNGVSAIGSNVFYDCANLILNEYDNAYYLGNENNPYITLISTKKLETSCQVHSQTKVIATDAFSGPSKMTSVYIPRSVLYINQNAFISCYDLSIYAEVENKPESWHPQYNPAGCDVFWNYQG